MQQQPSCSSRPMAMAGRASSAAGAPSTQSARRERTRRCTRALPAEPSHQNPHRAGVSLQWGRQHEHARGRGRAASSVDTAQQLMGADASKFNVCVSAGPDSPDMVFRFDIRNPDITVGEVLDAVQVRGGAVCGVWGGNQGCSRSQGVDRAGGGGTSGRTLEL